MQASSRNSQRGFTLVEIAIVLMIIGLLIGGILRGQELITSARVRNLIDQKSAIQTAYIGFMDRYRMLPGDLTVDQATIVGNGVNAATVLAGNGQSVIVRGDGFSDSPLLLQNLTASGFLACGVCTANGSSVQANINNSLVNAFGGVVRVGRAAGSTVPNANAYWGQGSDTNARMAVAQGASVDSQIAAEVDRKADDSFPDTGQYRFSQFDGNAGLAACVQNITLTGANRQQNVWTRPDAANCEATWLM